MKTCLAILWTTLRSVDYFQASITLALIGTMLPIPDQHLQTLDFAPEKGAEKVFIITNRKPHNTDSDSFKFSEKRGVDLSFGYLDTHAVEEASKASTEVKSTEDDFYEELTQSLHGKPGCMIVFVHGYNCDVKVPYKMALKLARQTKRPIVVFSWPSKRNPFTYTSDECNAEWSSFQLAQILDELEKRFSNQNITLIGHSMGCRLICWALQHNRAFESSPGSKYEHVLFCAPDMDSQIFEKNVPRLRECTDDTRVFASKKDVRLFFSKVLHGNARLGLLSRHSPDVPPNSEPESSVTLIDYTDDDRTIFGHAMPYDLIRQTIVGK